MNNNFHSFSALIIFLVIYSALVITGLAKLSGWSPFIYLLITIGCSILPDVLEPPTSWKHRKFFHSKRVLKFVLILLLIGFIIGWLTSHYYLFFGAMGYAIHLLEDSTTKIGLPE